MAEYLRDRGFLKGVDISNWQPNINYKALKDAGVEIVIMKASESNYYRDKYLDQHYNGCKAQGMKVGFYHFFRCDKNATEQARFFVNCISGKSFDVKLVLDIESNEGRGKSTVTAMAKEFLEEVKRLTGTEPMIYTYTSFANSYLDGSLAVYPKWIAQYSPLNPNPCSLCDSNGWDGFQFASDGVIANSGYPRLDINEFKTSVYLDGKTVSTTGGTVVSQPKQNSNGRTWSNQYDSQILELQKILNGKGKGFNLVEDGIMGENTYKAICNYSFDNGDRGDLCQWIQKRLNSMGFNCGNPDGIIGTNTVNAIHSWQRANGLGIGVLYASDFYYLCKSPVSGSQASTTTNSSNVNLHLRDLQGAYNKDYGRSILVDGIRGQQVEQMLNEICLSVNDTHRNVISWLQCRVGTSIDGIFGNNTKNAVMNFQRQHGLIVDGIAGKNTFNKLLEIYK